MNTTPAPHKPDYLRPLPPLAGALFVVALGTGIVFSLRGLGFFTGLFGILTAFTLVVLLMGGLAWVGAIIDQRTGREVTFRLVGAALGFAVLTASLYQLAPTFLGPGSTAREVGGDLR